MDLERIKSRSYSLEQLIESLSELHRASSEDLGQLDREIFFARQGEHWSPAEHVDHLIRSVRPLALALRLPRWLLGMLYGQRGSDRSSSEVVDSYLGKLARGAGAGGRYLPIEYDDALRTSESQERLLRRWLRSGESLTSALSGWRDRDLDHYRLPHPLLGKLTLREMVAWSLYHGHHHWSRIRERLEEDDPSRDGASSP